MIDFAEVLGSRQTAVLLDFCSKPSSITIVIPGDLAKILPNLVMLESFQNGPQPGDRADFRPSPPHAALLLIHVPPEDLDWIGGKTIVDSSSPLGHDPGGGAKHSYIIPLVKSARNVFHSKITVGRAKNNDIVIRSQKVSKLHCTFLVNDLPRYAILDMNSVNGTGVNGIRLDGKQPRQLQNGDLIVFWQYEFKFLDQNGILALLRSS